MEVGGPHPKDAYFGQPTDCPHLGTRGKEEKRKAERDLEEDSSERKK